MTRSPSVAAAESVRWRSVAVPTEHGGWGLTLEPVLLGLLLAPSWSGAAIGVAAFLAFLVRTPLKLAAVDRWRGRWLPRSRLAVRVAAVESVLIATLGAAAVAAAGWSWLVPIVAALPLVAIESWYDVRSRSRRLLPELCGSVGIAAVAAAIIVAGDGAWTLAVASWTVLAGRSVASIPFVRTQIARTHGRAPSLRTHDAFQLLGVAAGIVAAVVDVDVVGGSIAVGIVAIVQAVAVRREHVPPVVVVGIHQMLLGLGVVAATVIGSTF